MGRPLRSAQEGTWFHVVNRGAARAEIFWSDADRVEFGRLLGQACERFGVIVHAYCLMANHYHLVVECPEGKLSEAMHLIGSVFVRHANERMGRDGPLFRSRFYAKPVVDEIYLRRLVRYVHRNPLAFLSERELVGYRWSSLRIYLGFRRRPDWMHTDQIIGLFGSLEAFRTAMLEPAGDLDGQIAASPTVTLAAIDLMVEMHLGETAHQRVGRTAAVLLLDRLEPASAEALTRELGYASRGAVNSARTRARRRAESDDRLVGLVTTVRQFLS